MRKIIKEKPCDPLQSPMVNNFVDARGRPDCFEFSTWSKQDTRVRFGARVPDAVVMAVT